LVLLKRMEVECGSERFTAAGTLCRQELGTLGVVKVIKRERNQATALAVGRNAEKQRVAGSRGPALKTTVCASRDKMVFCAVH
jgi:hypothetical protein